MTKIITDNSKVNINLLKGNELLKKENEKLKLENEKQAQQLILSGVVSSFVYVLKAKDRDEPLWIYKTYQKAYRGKKNFAKKNWHKTYIEKWKIS